MRILAISDLHGDFGVAMRACRQVRPDLLLCCGDWGDPGEVSEADLAEFTAICAVFTTFGNHDDLELLARTSNADGSRILLEQGKVREANGLRIAAIGGIWAKSHRLPYYVTDDDVAAWSKTLAEQGPVDVLLTHGCPVGMADLTPSGRHGGQRCFLQAFQTVAPRLHLCGHLHVAQEKTTKDGRKVINVGATPAGSIAVIEYEETSGRLAASLTSIAKA
ncbi:MAG: metallophosphoesterase [Isosphaeraceae bacterium]